MEYVDGVSAAVLQHPYTLLFDADDASLLVASFTLNHVVRLRMVSRQARLNLAHPARPFGTYPDPARAAAQDAHRKTAAYKVFVSGRELDGPVGMALDGRHLYVASFTNDRILRVDADSGDLLGTLGNDEELDCPEGIAISRGRLYVASFLLKHIMRYDLETGECLGQFAPPPTGRPGPRDLGPRPTPLPSNSPTNSPRPPALLGAEDVAIDDNGDLHVTAYHSNAVHKFNGTTGAFELEYGRGILRGPVGIACGPGDGDMYVSSYRTHSVLRFSAGGKFVGVGAGAPPGAATAGRPLVANPSGLAFDPHDGTLHVLSYVSGAIVRFNATGDARTRVWRVTR